MAFKAGQVHYKIERADERYRTACGASLRMNHSTSVPNKVTCGACKRTGAYKEMMCA